MTDQPITRQSEACNCPCHTLPGIIHSVPCCKPTGADEFHDWLKSQFDAGAKLTAAGNRVEYDDNGELDEVVTDAGMHLERMSKKGWFLSGVRSDGTEIAIWFRGKVTMVEERPAPPAMVEERE